MKMPTNNMATGKMNIVGNSCTKGSISPNKKKMVTNSRSSHRRSPHMIKNIANNLSNSS